MSARGAKTKPRLFRSGLTETIYIVTRWTEKVAPNGTSYAIAHIKYEVTDAELAACGLEKLERIPDDEPDEPVERISDLTVLARAWLHEAGVLIEPSAEYDKWLRQGPAHVRALVAEPTS